MKALTLDGYWAWAIFHAGKNVENRTWYTDYRGPLAIHAGLTRSRDRDARQQLESIGVDVPDDVQRGAIIGVVHVDHIVPVDELPDNIWASGPYCWQISGAQLIKPIECTGRLNLWSVPASWAEEIRQQIDSVSFKGSQR